MGIFDELGTAVTRGIVNDYDLLLKVSSGCLYRADTLVKELLMIPVWDNKGYLDGGGDSGGGRSLTDAQSLLYARLEFRVILKQALACGVPEFSPYACYVSLCKQIEI